MATYLELQKQIESLQAQAEKLRAEERKGVIDRMIEAIRVYDIIPQDLGFARSGGAVSRPSKGTQTKKSSQSGKKGSGAAYVDQQGNTWGGRGPRPKWLRDALATGAKLEDFAAAGRR